MFACKNHECERQRNGSEDSSDSSGNNAIVTPDLLPHNLTDEMDQLVQDLILEMRQYNFNYQIRGNERLAEPGSWVDAGPACCSPRPRIRHVLRR